jgi:Domain of unknown function (DUF4136)
MRLLLNPIVSLRTARLAFVAGLAMLLAACTTPITTKVTSFNVWPANAPGATFSYVAKPTALGELEQATYENYVRTELERQGLKPAAAGQVGRFLVDVTATGTTRKKKFREPIYQYQQIWYPPYRDRNGNVYPGYWGPDQFGPRYVGDRQVTRTVQVSRLQLKLLDSEAGTPGKPRAVFESTAVYEGDNEDLPDLVPYLVRAAFEEFPGQNGGVRVLKFNPESGELIRK